MLDSNKPELMQDSNPNSASVSTGAPVGAPEHAHHHYLRNTGIALLTLTAIIVFIFWFFQYTGKPLMKIGGEGSSVLSGEYSVKDVEPKAFGDLNVTAIAATPDSVAEMSSPARVADQKMMAPGIGDGVGIPNPFYRNYKFKYVGGDLPVIGELQEVYRLTTPNQNQGFVDSVVRVLSVGLIDLQKMRAPKMDYLAFSEERPMGYTFNLDMNMGYISVSQNWKFWPQLPTVCDQNYCGPIPRLKPEDVLSEDEAVKIAENFFNDYGISREGLGQPYLDKNWYGGVRPLEASDIYIPDQVSVIYPKVIEGRTVYNESGIPEGLQVAIDNRQKAVAGVYGVSKNQYERSLYPGEQDVQKIKEVVERGGFRNYVYEDPNAEELVLEVDTPTTAVVSMWYSRPGSNYSEQLYVNSLLFPIKDARKNNYWREYLIVPLVKEILGSDNQMPPVMPFVKEGAAESSNVESMPAPMAEVMPSM